MKMNRFIYSTFSPEKENSEKIKSHVVVKSLEIHYLPKKSTHEGGKDSSLKV